MKYSVFFKFLAVLLCVLALMGAAASGIGMLGLGAEGLLNNKPLEEVYAQHNQYWLGHTASSLAENWASNVLGGVPKEITDWMNRDTLSNHLRPEGVYYTITDKDGKELFSNYSGQEIAMTKEYTMDSIQYQVLVPDEYAVTEPVEETDETTFPFEETEDTGTASMASAPAVTEAPDYPGPEICSNDIHTDTGWYSYLFTMDTAPGCKVTLYLEEDAMSVGRDWPLLQLLVQYRSRLLPILIVSGLVFAAMAVYLCVSAGHRPGSEEVKPGGLNLIPLDLYGGLVLGYLVFCALFLDETARGLLDAGLQPFLLCLGLLMFFGCLIFVGFCFACAAQFKMKNWYWLRSSLCGRCIRLAWRICIPVCRWAWGLCLRIFHACTAILHWCFRQLERIFSMLPLTWQWIVGGCAIGVLTTAGFAGEFPLILALAGVLILYAAHCFGVLLDAARKMRRGELEAKVEDKYLVGSFKDFAGELNGLADVAVVAAQKQLKSERMKTELITNVSHDIKTPLTSIINYVDLLEKPHTSEEEHTYLEVLSRQSRQLKKLIEDLIEMSKATTGNIPVDIAPMDAVETVTQALGEYSGKLEAAGLTPVFNPPASPVMMLADGRLTWRVLSNLLSNAVKYALPGTRLYMDVSRTGSNVVISVKNISRSELNISAEELMERFVRGDTSRNTEGSGLGLNIAKSLMELQKGQLQLLVDGDLFKVTMVFPKG